MRRMWEFRAPLDSRATWYFLRGSGSLREALGEAAEGGAFVERIEAHVEQAVAGGVLRGGVEPLTCMIRNEFN